MRIPLRSLSRFRGPPAALLASALATIACDSATAPAAVALSGESRRVLVRNTTDAPIYTFVVGRIASASIDWYPCVDAVACPPIAPGRAALRPVAVGVQRIGEIEALVYWWNAVERPDGSIVHGSVRHMVVELK